MTILHMASASERKLFLGMRLKRLRRDLALTQSRMAEDLAISPSYLNHLERNQRPLTAQILLRLAQTYDIDVRGLGDESDGADARDLSEVLADPLFRDIAIPRHEVTEVAREAPGVADAIVRLYRAYGDRRRGGSGERLEDASTSPAPSDWVGDYIETQRNFFPDLDLAGEALAAELAPEPQGFWQAARQRLADRHGVQVRVMPADVMSDTLRQYDHHRRRVLVSERLRPPGQAFALAYQLSLFEQADAIAAHVARAGAPDAVTARLLKVTLANYAAAATMMPYEPFHRLCEEMSYDLEGVATRFGASFEQVCHRLTTLSRPRARGIPFFMLRIDVAGNVSKRFSGGAFPFSRLGGVCPRWNIHAVFRSPGRVLPQIVQTLDGARFFTLARTVPRAAAMGGEQDFELAVGVGCDLKYAPKLAQARGLNLENPVVTEIGPACRVCERVACAQRAAEPLNRVLTVEDFVKLATPYPFSSGLTPRERGGGAYCGSNATLIPIFAHCSPLSA